MRHSDGRRIERFDAVRSLDHPVGRFDVQHLHGDEEAVEAVLVALKSAAPQMEVWGRFRVPVVVRVYPDHASLELAVHRVGYDWLRAWARYDEVFLQSPSTYSIFESGPGNLAELLTHEITHCLMYQLAASRSDWRRKDRQIPIWYREGMASWTASQGHRRMSEARIGKRIRETGEDPIADAGSLYQDESEIVYGAAHWAFSFLVERYGQDAVRDTLKAMATGVHFADAFGQSVGLSVRAFEAEFVRYLTWDGWLDRVHPSPRAGRGSGRVPTGVGSAAAPTRG